jgi:hypothetical protein
MADDSDPDTSTDPQEMGGLYRAFRAGFLESGEGWNGELYYGNPDGYERRLQARFEALKESGAFHAVPVSELEQLTDKWDEYDDAPDEACARELRELIGKYSDA